MSKPDEGHVITERELQKLERKIAKVYGEAAKELDETIKNYFDGFKKRDAEMQKLIGTEQNGKIWTEQDYKQWRINQIGRGKRFEALRDKLADRMTRANEVAVSYVNDATPTIYSINRNYTAYTIEQFSPYADFILYDERTVKRLIKENPNLMPHYPKWKAVKRGIDLDYGRKQITSSVLSGILQGKGIGDIARDLRQRIVTMSLPSAIRTARTAVTEAQNAGRQDGYDAAAQMGIKVRKRWLATLDGRTRHDHGMLDGQTVAQNKPFEYGGYKLMFPGDGELGAPGYTLYNCRCTMVTVDELDDMLDPGMRRAIDPETGESVLVPWVTYSEWLGQKKLVNDDKNVIINSEIKRDTAKGNPAAIIVSGAKLNNRQQKLLHELPQYDSTLTTRKNTVSLRDLSALTASTGDEFALFTKGGERLVIRGNKNSVNVDKEKAIELAKQGYRWSGHTHPGIEEYVLQPSKGDMEILKIFNQKKSQIVNSAGHRNVFEV